MWIFEYIKLRLHLHLYREISCKIEISQSMNSLLSQNGKWDLRAIR